MIDSERCEEEKRRRKSKDCDDDLGGEKGVHGVGRGRKLQLARRQIFCFSSPSSSVGW